MQRTRNLSSLALRGPNEPLAVDAIIGISETVLLFLEHSQFGKQLDALNRPSLSLGERWRKMTEVMLHSQLHTIAPFGFKTDGSGIQAYSQACQIALSKASPSDMKDIQVINKDTWGVLVKRAFGVKTLSWMELSTARSLVLGVCSQLVSPVNLGHAEKIQLEKKFDPARKVDEIHNQVIIPSYKHCMGTLGMSLTDPSFAMTYASLQVWMLEDAMIAQTMQHSVQELMKRAPVMRGG